MPIYVLSRADFDEGGVEVSVVSKMGKNEAGKRETGFILFLLRTKRCKNECCEQRPSFQTLTLFVLYKSNLLIKRLSEKRQRGSFV